MHGTMAIMLLCFDGLFIVVFLRLLRKDWTRAIFTSLTAFYQLGMKPCHK